MGQKLVVGPINKGLRNDVEPFNINNDNFPVLINAYQWRGRIKRKRGTAFCTRLTYVYEAATYAALDGSGNQNLLTQYSITSSSSPKAEIVPGSVTIRISGTDYTDPDEDGTLSPSGSINYSTGAILIAGEAGNTPTATTFSYYPGLPVMGLEEWIRTDSRFPGTLAFDTKYSYLINTNNPYTNYNVNFYKNPPTGTYTNYVEKSAPSELVWNGQDYQQFWSANYQGSFWVTNGINIPFSVTNVGMQYKPIVDVTGITGGPPASATLQITGHGLEVGDFLFVNEVATTTGINFQTGYVTTVTDANNVVVTFPNATIATNGTGGIAQYLTRSSDGTKDCMRWFDGDPTTASNANAGWVNFCPPLSQADFSIGDLPADQYYLVTARMIMPFKDRILFIGPVVQTSSAGSQVYLQDMVIYSQNGTPYYTSSFTGDVNLTTTTFNQLLVPTNQTATANAYFSDNTGFGGFVQAGTDSKINTVNNNEDVLLMGFGDRQARFIYTSNDLVPFNFYVVDSELPSHSTFSVVNLGTDVMTAGHRGLVLTTQTSATRMDRQIPDEVFQFRLSNNGTERVTAQRDYINEWIYLTYPTNSQKDVFPTKTLQYNYRDQSWAIFEECFTTYGQFKKTTGYTWATIGTKFPTWASWNEPWNSGTSTLFQPEVIGGNQSGYVLFRDESTNESPSIPIKNISFPATITGATQANPCVLTASNSFVPGQQITISDVAGMTELNGNTYTITAATTTTITIDVDSSGFTAYSSGGTATPLGTIYAPDHCFVNNDYITISDALGTVSSEVNGIIFKVYRVDNDNFNLNQTISSGTYLGSGQIKKIYRPFIQTKQFPTNWGSAQKTRIGTQQYLLSTTENSAVTLLMYLSQNADSPYNEGSIVPDLNTVNSSLIYGTTLYTCPESTNLGLTPANTNLQMPTAIQQQQTWHRINTSLIGDTVQLAITLSDEQMEDSDFTHQFSEIELHGFIIDVSPSQVLA